MFSIRRLFGSLLGGSAALLLVVGQAGASSVDPQQLAAAIQGVEAGAVAAQARIDHHDSDVTIDAGLAKAIMALDSIVSTRAREASVTAQEVLQDLIDGTRPPSAAGGLGEAYDEVRSRGQDIAEERGNAPEEPPGQSDDSPGQSDDPPGQPDDPPGQSDDPPGQSDDPPVVSTPSTSVTQATTPQATRPSTPKN